jgi:hypothetical protein
MNEYKIELLDTLNMLSDIERQKKYFSDTKIADVPSDLICGWFDTGFFVDDEEFRNHFSSHEWGILLEFNDYFDSKVDGLPHEFTKLIQDSNWLKIVGKAKDTLYKLNW